jgi:glyoxylase-like metal-dependent hydrolase (beta-lactamase superfamily II)
MKGVPSTPGDGRREARANLAAMLLPVALAGAAPAPTGVRLYTLDCGRIDLTDMANFSDTGDHDGKHGAMPVTCFLIHHGADWMPWDAGLGDEIAASPAGRDMVGLHFRVPRTLASQLAELKLTPEDIRDVGLSHLHADHSGNAALFPHATFLVAPADLAWASASRTPDGVAVRRSRAEPVAADRDVFRDGSVRMVGTPGHTIGHHSLMMHLPRTGWVILMGDVAHFAVNYARDLVPLGNAKRADTIERVKGLAAHYNARVIVQHAADIFETMPRFPAYLD